MQYSTLALSRPQPSSYRWVALAVPSAVLHALLLIFVTAPATEHPAFQPRPRMLQVELSALSFDEPPSGATASESSVAAPVVQAPAPPIPKVKPAVEPPSRPLEPEVKTPSPEPERKPDVQPESAKPETKAVEEPPPFDAPRPSVAYDTGKASEKAPEKSQFLGDVNSEAADRAEKNKPFGGPAIQGESKEVAFSGRRGEDEMKVNRPPDPLAGTATVEGSPDAGRPPEPKDGKREDDTAKNETGAKPLVAPEREQPPALAPLPPSGNQSETPVAPQDLGKAELPKPEVGEKRDGTDGQPEGLEKAGGEGDLPSRGEARTARGPQTGGKDLHKNPLPVIAENAPKPQAPDGSRLPIPIPENSGKPEPQKDPERGRVEELLKGLTRATPDNAQPQPGAAVRKGQLGVQGDGTARPGERNAVSDVISDYDVTVAVRSGEVSFAKRASPEAAYLKEYLARVNAAWKRLLVADNRIRLERGAVGMRFTLSKDGKLLEAIEIKREGDILDQNAGHCKRAIHEAAPHEPFPTRLSGKEKLTATIMFLY